MRSSRLLLALCAGALLLGSGCRPAELAPGPPASVRTYSIEQFLGTTSFLGSSFSPDGSKILVSSDEGGIYNAYAIRREGGESVQLTHSRDESIRVQGYFPHDERFLYLADRGGDELDHLYVHELDGSRTDLTPGAGHRAKFLGWSRDGDRLFVATNERDQRYFDTYEIRADDYEKSLIYQDAGGYEIHEVSADGRYIALGRMRTRHDTDILLYDRRAGAIRNLTAHRGNVAHRHQTFSPDGKSIYYTSDEGSEFAYLVRQDLQTGARQTVLRPPWDVMLSEFSKRGRYLIVGINADAGTELRILDGTTMEELEVPPLPKGDVTSISVSEDETRMSFYLGTSRTPPNLYVYAFDARPPAQLTHALNPEIDERDLVHAEVRRFSSHDGLEIPGLLYRPHGASSGHRVPALVWVHGGPGGQSRIAYNALVQYLVNHGYAIYAINNRGSSGYGKSFYKADDRGHGQADLEDCVASKRMLAQTGFIDPERIGIIGGSYGGYLVLAALSFRPQAFAAGVDMWGISNWVRTLERMPVWWESLRTALFVEIGDPQTDRHYLERISPLHHARNIAKPLMVLQGANDPRVLRSESDDIVRAVRANGVPVEYLVFDDEGHGFRKKENRVRAYRAVLEFLDRHVKGVHARSSPGGAAVGLVPADASASEPGSGRT